MNFVAMLRVVKARADLPQVILPACHKCFKVSYMLFIISFLWWNKGPLCITIHRELFPVLVI